MGLFGKGLNLILNSYARKRSIGPAILLLLLFRGLSKDRLPISELSPPSEFHPNVEELRFVSLRLELMQAILY